MSEDRNIIPFHLRVRPWPIRLWKTYAGLRRLGYGVWLSMKMTWATQRPRLWRDQ